MYIFVDRGEIRVDFWYRLEPLEMQSTVKRGNFDSQEALAYNGLTVAQTLIPCRPNMGTIPMIAAMAEGTQLQGSLTRSGAAFTVAGRSTDGLYEFRIETGTLRPTG